MIKTNVFIIELEKGFDGCVFSHAVQHGSTCRDGGVFLLMLVIPKDDICSVVICSNNYLSEQLLDIFLRYVAQFNVSNGGSAINLIP